MSKSDSVLREALQSRLPLLSQHKHSRYNHGLASQGKSALYLQLDAQVPQRISNGLQWGSTAALRQPAHGMHSCLNSSSGSCTTASPWSCPIPFQSLRETGNWHSVLLALGRNQHRLPSSASVGVDQSSADKQKER